MFLEYIDILSPPITLKFKGNHSHSSKLSGILTIISILVIIFFSIYFSLDIILKKHPNPFYFIQFIEDSGYFYMNSSSVFHYTYYDNNKTFNPHIYKVIGLNNTLYSNYKLDNANYTIRDHYIYEQCNEYSNDLNLNNISNVIDVDEYFNKGLCMSKFYNSTTKTFISIKDSNFPYPMMAHGASNPNIVVYAIYLQKCINNSDYNNNDCETQEKINEYFNYETGPIKFYMLNQEVDIKDYKNPMQHKLFFLRTNFINASFAIENLNFQPILVSSNEGLFFDNYKDIYSYHYEQNDIKTMTDNNGVINGKNFWIQNSCLTYERVYLTIPRLLVEIGGFSKMILIIANLLNKILYRYKTLIDIEKILITKEERLKSKFGEQKTLSFNKIKSISQNRENSRKSSVLNNNYLNTQIFKGLENNKNNVKSFNDNINNNENNLVLNNSQDALTKIKNNNNFSTKISKFHTDILINEKIISKISFFYVFKYFLFINVNKHYKFNHSHYQYIHLIFHKYKKIISEENLINVYYFLKNINHNLDIYKNKKMI